MHNEKMFLLLRQFALILFCSVVIASAPCCAQQPAQESSSVVPLEKVDAATRSRWLLDGTVVDAESGKPIREFVVTPASLSTDDNGKTILRWRDNLNRTMRGGVLKWPRTSGFSVMRFKITAAGYRTLVTPTMPRGGPYVRIRIKLVRETSAKAPSS